MSDLTTGAPDAPDATPHAHLDPLPPSAALARKVADPKAILRLVGHDEPVDELPRTPEGIIEPPSGTGTKIRNGVLLALLSGGFVWLVTINAWDHDGFFPWFWNVVWAVFPWLFLAPMWGGYARSLRRSRDDAPLWAQYHRDRQAAVRTTGVVRASVTDRTDSGGVATCVVRVEHGPLTTTVQRLAPVQNLLPSEVPQPGDRVVVFRLPGGRTVVQARRDRTRPLPDAGPVASPEPVAHADADADADADAPAYGTPSSCGTPSSFGTPTPTAAAAAAPGAGLVAELRELADLHAAGALTDAEFAAAKRRLLGDA